MPIHPSNAALYGPNWVTISLEVRTRAGWRCEGSPAYPDCRAEQDHPHTFTGSLVVLTVAHLDHDPANNGTSGDRPNLKARCQRCHLNYDRAHHLRNAHESRRARKALGDLFEETA